MLADTAAERSTPRTISSRQTGFMLVSDAGDLKSRIRRSYANLRPSEQIVADYLSQFDGQRLDRSITELARAIGVSESTVSRVSKALGFSGYSDMKLSIAAGSAIAAPDHANLPANLKPADSVSEIARKLAGVFASGIADTERSLDPDRLDRGVRDILDADKVVFIGVGGAAAICQEAAHMFLKIGIDAISQSDGYMQTVAASVLRPGSLLIGISHTGSTPTVVSALRIARRNGVRTMAITGDADSALAAAADLVFATGEASSSIPLHGDFIEGRICQLYLIDVLYVGVMFRAGSTARRHLALTTKALADHFGTTLRRESEGKPRLKRSAPPKRGSG